MTTHAVVDIPSNVVPYHFAVGKLGALALPTREDLQARQEAEVERSLDESEGAEGLSFQVVRFGLREAFSEVGRLDLQVMAPSAREILPAEVMGKPASFAWACGTEEARAFRYFHGIVTQFAESGATEGAGFYDVAVMPRPWRLGVRRRSRIFQNLSVPDIASQVLQDGGLSSGTDFKLSLFGTYEPRKYCVQYRESDLNFITRLLEDEGIYYWFEHSDTHETMVLADSPTTHTPAAPFSAVVVQARADDAGSDADDDSDASSATAAAGDGLEERIQSFRFAHALHPGRVHLRDYNFMNSANAPVVEESGWFTEEPEVYDYPGGFYTESRARQLVRVRMEEIDTHTRVAQGRGDFRSLAVGRTFEILDHPRDSYNRKYLCTAVAHRGASQAQIDSEGRPAGMGSSSYENEFVCIPDEVPYRPPRLTPKPVITGVQTAKVVGPPGEEIYTDEFLRIKVQFHWDREGQSDENSSCWLRVVQKWADSGFGSAYIPRIGQEVLVEFVEGDPDRPIVNGCIYNDLHMPPFALPGKKMQTGLRSNTTPGGGGSNEIRLDDSAGGEEVFIHAQKDQNNVVGNNETTNVGNDRTETVGNNETITIGNNRTESVGSNETISVGSNRTETVGANESITIGSNRTETVGANESITVALNRDRNVGISDTINVGAMQAINVGAAQSISVGANQSNSIGANRSSSIGANDDTDVGGNQSTSVGGQKSTTVGKDYVIAVKKDFNAQADKKVLIDGADQVTVQSGKAHIQLKKNGDILIEGKDITIKASGNVTIKGSKILEN